MNRYRTHFSIAGLLAIALLSQTSMAEEKPDALVDGLRSPAWVERQGERRALSSGFQLNNRDRVVTGSDARVRIRLKDGAVVALGADARMEINALGVRGPNIFTAALDVQQGAIRYSAAALPGKHPPHAINLRVGAIVSSSRGTDLLWGSTDQTGDRVCLLEGRIAVLHPQAEPLQLTEPLHCYVARTGEGDAPPALEAVTSEQFAVFVAQTDMRVENGVDDATTMAAQAKTPAHTRNATGDATTQAMPRFPSRPVAHGGRWTVDLATVESEAEALALYDRVRAAGYVGRIKPLATAGGYRYTVRVAALASRDDAAAVAASVAEVLERTSPDSASVAISRR